ncbi:MAG: hypothetical protein H0W12_04845 [Chitinophagaceae bacterium]|nr:hypothetical protein [Chitinophagaceae bacterium]
MRVIKLIYFLLVFIACVKPVTAQKNIVVYHISGDVKLLSEKKLSPAKRGDIISKKMELMISESATCMLIDPAGRSLQISKPASYSFDALIKMFSAATSSNVSAAFFKYVYENLFTADKNEKLAATPVVFRGEDLMKSPGNYSIIEPGAILFTWRKLAGKNPVRIIIKNEKEVIFDSVFKNSIFFKFKPGNKILPANSYTWSATISGGNSINENHFLVEDETDYPQIKKNLKLLENKKLLPAEKLQLQVDIFNKWIKFYSPG